MRQIFAPLTAPFTRLLLVAVLVATLTAAPGPGTGPGIARAIDVADDHAQEVLGHLEGVIGFGVGVNGQGRAVIFAFTENAGVGGIPAEIDGVPVVPHVTGLVYAIHHACGHDGGPPNSTPFPCEGAVGITVSPTSGLVTTEDLGTDSFTVVLDTEPSDPVTIDLSSDDTAEGTVSPTSLTFTTDNWATTQTVTVTGVDDGLVVDGDIVYNIVTAAANSLDLDYNGLNAADVEVTNLDNDGVAVGNDCFETGDTTARCDRAVPIGVSTGHPDITAGTIGARVVDGNGDLFALSNNHVYADLGNASLGDAVIQPGTFDGGSSPADDIGTLSAFKEIVFGGPDNTIDAAIAATTAGEVGNATPSDGYGTPSATTTVATINAKVRKYGRTTGQTNGFVWTTNTTVNVCYDSDCTLVARFVNQVSFKGQGRGDFSLGGDSGSLIVTRSRNNPMALLFAGNSVLTFGNPIAAVLDEFSVTIDGL